MRRLYNRFRTGFVCPIEAAAHVAAWASLVTIFLVQPSQDAYALTLINNGVSNVVIPDSNVPAFETSLFIQNAGCNATIVDPCAAPGAPTSVTIPFWPQSFLAIEVRETSILSMAFAQIFKIDALESSTVTFEDGTLNFFSAFDSSSVELAGSSGIVNSNVQDQAVLTVSGGIAAPLAATGFAEIFLRGGSASQVTLADDARLEMTGGQLQTSLALSGASSALLAGGVISGAVSASDTVQMRIEGGVGLTVLTVLGSSAIDFVGSGFAVDGAAVPFGPISATSGTLTGVLLDGSALTVAFGRSPTATIQLPEPRADWAAMLVLCSLLLAKTIRMPNRLVNIGRRSTDPA